ncbi:MAG TPA: DUF6458 family protein [Micromonosporaceae bacterium]|nr:DUF6458 family protein [Micromonosporaceae bacterium]
MGIGGSILLIALGAILTFGLNVTLGWLDLDVVGWVLMLTGLFGLILTTWFWSSRRRRTVVRTNPAGSHTVRRTDVVGPPDTL